MQHKLTAEAHHMRSLIVLVLSFLLMLPAQAADPRLPLSSVLPGAGVTVGVDLANECQSGSLLNGSTHLSANSVGSSQIAANTIQHASVTLTPAQIKTLYSAPTQIIAAPGSGKTIVVLSALATFTYTTPQYTSGGAVALQYDSTVHAGGTTPLTTLAAAVVTAAATSVTQLQTAGSTTTAASNKGIYASAATADFATGTVSTLTFDVAYVVI